MTHEHKSPMTPAELRAAGNAMAERAGGGIEVDFAIWGGILSADKPPAIVTVRYDSRSSTLMFRAETFEEALALAETGWAAKRDELRAKALADARARVAELESAAA